MQNPEPSSTPRSDRLIVFDIARGLATSTIVLLHLYEFQTWDRAFRFLYPVAWTAVEWFFVLSGFLIGGILMDNAGASNYFKTFYVRRVFRILPLYALLLAVYAVVIGTGVFGGDARLERFVSPTIPWAHLLTFTQNVWWAGPHPGFTPFLLAPTWTLAVEEQFYLVLPLLLWMTPRHRQPVVFLLCIVAAPVWRFFIFGRFGATAAYILFPGQLDTLFIGVLAAWAVRYEPAARWLSAHRRLLLTALVVLAAGCALASYQLWGPWTFVVTVFGVSWLALFYVLITYFAATVPRIEALARQYARPIAWVGTRSFSIYLFHVPLIATLKALLPSSSVHVHLVLLVATLAPLAACCWRWLERPCISYSRRTFPFTFPPAQPVAAGTRAVAEQVPMLN